MYMVHTYIHMSSFEKFFPEGKYIALYIPLKLYDSKTILL